MRDSLVMARDGGAASVPVCAIHHLAGQSYETAQVSEALGAVPCAWTIQREMQGADQRTPVLIQNFHHPRPEHTCDSCFSSLAMAPLGRRDAGGRRVCVPSSTCMCLLELFLRAHAT